MRPCPSHYGQPSITVTALRGVGQNERERRAIFPSYMAGREH
jgi:hypothetical protein